jgi:cytidyltransferase-like protein
MRVVVISGYFNPLHVGHLDYIYEAKKLGEKLIVIVNNDEQVKIKGSVPFMSEEDRIRIVESITPVSGAILSIDSDESVVETLRSVYDRYNFAHGWYPESTISLIFANGGDRNLGSTPEEEFCKEVGIKTVYGVGGVKTESSSKLIANSKGVKC